MPEAPDPAESPELRTIVLRFLETHRIAALAAGPVPEAVDPGGRKGTPNEGPSGSSGTRDSAIDGFLSQYWHDHDHGCVRSLLEYLVLHPGDPEEVARRFLALRAADSGSRASSDADSVPRIGSYRIVRELGRGGQGVVYLAEDRALHRRVALKVLHAAAGMPGSESLRRFQREAEIASSLDDPGICSVYASGMVEGVPYIAMRFVEGVTLSRVFAGGATAASPESVGDEGSAPSDGDVDGASSARPVSTQADIARILNLVEKVARTLHKAHEAGIIHRDIKPGNIMVTAGGEAVVLDFGLARQDDPQSSVLTQSGELFGSPAYMSPEQITGRIHLDRRTDVYSLGVVLYEGVTGRRPFEGATRSLLFDEIQFRSPPDPRTCNPAVSRDLAIVLATALEKDRHRRYQSAAAFADDLRRVLSREPIAARPAGPLLRFRRWVQRNPRLALAVLSVFVLLVLGLGLSLWLLDREARALLRAEAERARTELMTTLLFEEVPRIPVASPRNLPVLGIWLGMAETTLTRLRESRDELAANGAKLAPERKTLLSALVDVEPKVERFRGLLEEAGRTARAAISPPSEAELSTWDAVISAIADAKANPHYSGLRLDRISGFLPLGPDPDSKLFEFLHVPSGEAPLRGADGRWVIGPRTGMIFVLLPGGEVEIGSQADDPGAPYYDPAIPEHERGLFRIVLSPLLVSKYEVTQAQWRRLTGDAPSRYAPGRTPHGTGTAGGIPLTEVHPVEQVSWRDARRVFSSLDLELPTEVQWEYACRARTTTPYSTGDDAESLEGAANLADEGSRDHFGPGFPFQRGFADGHAVHAPVGSFLPNAFGLHDLHGNVWELCRDSFGPVSVPPRGGDGLREPPGDSGMRAARGGGFLSRAPECRSALRSAVAEISIDQAHGLRPVKAILPSPR